MPRARLDPGSQLTYDLFRRERELAVESFTYPSELVPVNPFDSMPLLFAQTGAGSGPVRDPEREGFRELARAEPTHTRDGRHKPSPTCATGRGAVTRCRASLVEQMLPLLAALGEDTPANVFYQPHGAMPADARAAPNAARLTDGIRPGVKQHDPARRIGRCTISCATNICRARGQSVGLSALPLGESWYAFLIKREISSRLSAGEIHALGTCGGRTPAWPHADAARRGRLRRHRAGVFRGDAPRPPPHLQERRGVVELSTASRSSTTRRRLRRCSAPPRADFAIRASTRSAKRPSPHVLPTGPAERQSPRPCCTSMPRGIDAQPVTASQPLFLREALPGHH